MNDLMTYSLVGYTNFNDEEEEVPTETETEAEASAADKKLRRFLAEAEAANKEMAAIRHLLARLQQAHGETQYSLSDPDSLRSLRRRINADLLLALRTARHVRARLDAMDSDPEPAAASSVGAGLRAKLRELIADIQELRRRMAADHREAVARCYFVITGERPDEALLERIASMSGGDELMLLKKAVAEGRGGGGGDLVVAVQEMEDRQEVASGLERSLLELQQLFLDMAVLVDAQAHHLDDIEQQVAAAADYVGDGAQALEDARQYQNSARRKSAWIALAILLLLLLFLAVVVAVVAINLSKKSTHIYSFTFLLGSLVLSSTGT